MSEFARPQVNERGVVKRTKASPRVKNGERRRMLPISLTEREYQTVELGAEIAGASKSRWIIDRAIHQSEVVSQADLDVLVEEMVVVSRQLRGIATNLNQIAHGVNIDGELPEDFTTTVAELKDAHRKNVELMNRVALLV